MSSIFLFEYYMALRDATSNHRAMWSPFAFGSAEEKMMQTVDTVL
jgi:hypothetical protein